MFVYNKYRRSVLIVMAKNQPKEIRIKQIIDTAVFEFIDKGYEGSSMESIARRAGLSKGGLYHHFKSKDEILIEANNRFMEPIIDQMEICRKNPSPVKGLKKYVQAYLKHWSTHPGELKFTFLSLFKIMSQEELWPEMDSYFKYVTGFFSEMLSAGIEQGELIEHDTASRAIAMASSLDGITPYLTMCKGLSIKKTADKLIRTFIGEIEAR